MRKDILPVWTPTESFSKGSRLWDYMQWLKTGRGLAFNDYDALWQWSVDKPSDFWASFWDYAGIISHRDYTSVLTRPPSGMIGTGWFEGATLNYAEHIFRNSNSLYPAIIFENESGVSREISWAELSSAVAKLAAWMKEAGVIKGDRVVSVMPNIPETVIAFLAAQSIGAIWSSCSPDFGNPSIIDRFLQVEPKVLFVTDGYMYNGKEYTKTSAWEELRRTLVTVQQVVMVPCLENPAEMKGSVIWDDIMKLEETELVFEPLAFDHPYLDIIFFRHNRQAKSHYPLVGGVCWSI